LRRGNVTAPGAHARLRDELGLAPRALQDVLAERPSQVQDRWQAQLYFLAPALQAGVVALWLLSAWAGWVASAEQIRQLVAGSLLQDWAPVAIARFAGGMDLLLALWLLSGRKQRMAIAAMIALVLLYTVVFGLALPALWLDPLGGLAKNLAVLPALAVLWVVSDRR